MTINAKDVDLKARLLEELLDISDKDYREDLKSRGLSVESLAAQFDSVLERSEADALRRRYDAARKHSRGAPTAQTRHVSAPQARAALQKLTQAGAPFLLAARKGRPLGELPDAELQSLIKDALDLGLLDPKDLE